MKDNKSLLIDLSFDNNFKELFDKGKLKDNIELNNKVFWSEEISCWIDFLRQRKPSQCPDSVLKANSISLGLRFTDDEHIASLNSLWRHKNEKTDVLAFPVIDEQINFPYFECLEIGDIVVSLITADNQAQEQGHTLLDESRWLVSHGLLHLLGWDHPNPERQKQMLLCQEQLLKNSGNLQKKREQKKHND